MTSKPLIQCRSYEQMSGDNPRHFPEPYRRQKGWEKPDNKENDFQPLTEEQMKQLSFFDE